MESGPVAPAKKPLLEAVHLNDGQPLAGKAKLVAGHGLSGVCPRTLAAAPVFELDSVAQPVCQWNGAVLRPSISDEFDAWFSEIQCRLDNHWWAVHETNPLYRWLNNGDPTILYELGKQ